MTPRFLASKAGLYLVSALWIVAAAAPGWGCDSSTKDAASNQAATAANAGPKRASMSFGFIHTLEDIPPNGPVILSAEDGATIEIQEAYLVVSAIEVHLCEPKTAARTPGKQGRRGVFPPLSDRLIPTAWAHVPSSATRLGTPFVEDLLAPGRARIIDEIAPPFGRYCALYAVLSPADDDVVNLSGLDRGDIEHKALLLRGRYRLEGSDADDPQAWTQFSSASSARDVIQIAAIDPKTGTEPLVLTASDDSRMMLLDKRVSPDLFAGISPAEFDDETAANRVIKRLEKRLKIYEFERD